MDQKKSEIYRLRAKTYTSVAVGQCPLCKTPQLNIRFVYNPYGDDFLACLSCGDHCDNQYPDPATQSGR